MTFRRSVGRYLLLTALRLFQVTLRRTSPPARRRRIFNFGPAFKHQAQRIERECKRWQSIFSLHCLAVFLCATIVLMLPLGSCSNEAAFITADYAKCRELGFSPGEKEYDVCPSEVQRRRLTTSSEQN